MAEFLRSKCHLELFQWRNNTQIALHSLGVVIVNVVPNHSNKLLLGGKSLAIIFLVLQDAPESLHRAIVNAVGYTRHTLRHTGFFQHMVKGSVCILETAVTVERRMCVWVSQLRNCRLSRILNISQILCWLFGLYGIYTIFAVTL